MVIDIGGGSTEVIVAEAGVVRLRDSLPLGSVRLTETFVHHDPALTSEVAAVSSGIEPALSALAVARGRRRVLTNWSAPRAP